MKKIDQQILDILRQCRVEDLIVYLPAVQLERGLYVSVNAVLEMIGGKWNKKVKGHVFESDPNDALGEVVATGEVLDAKKEFQFYPTPDALADRMVELADIDFADSILEPSCGKGAILKAIFKTDWSGDVCACDVQDFSREVRDISPEIIFCRGNFLEFNAGTFDRIIANPPFSKGQDIAHVLKMWSLLNAGTGRLVTITSPGWLFRMDKKHTEFREFVKEVGGEWEELPSGTFKESGTDVRTVLLTMKN